MMNPTRRTLAVVFFLLGISPLVGVAGSETLTGKIICGYQGWFRTPSDGISDRWTHYGNPPGSSIEFWPDVSELSAEERFATPQTLANGQPAEVFSSVIPATVMRHFAWMETYGIDGAFLQRFVGQVVSRGGKTNNLRRGVNQVLLNVRAGAQAHGRSWAVMYDLSGLKGSEEIAGVMADWRHLIDDLKVTQNDPAYQHHRGKPVVAVWGLGFNDNRSYSPSDVGRLVDFLKNDPVYGGNCVLLGVPTYWRTGKIDAIADPELLRVIAMADIVQPWLVNRFATPDEAHGWVEQHMKEDRAWCDAHQLEYMPVLFPGFRWTNHLVGKPEEPPPQDGTFVWSKKEIPRLGGKFLWAQFVAAQRSGASLFYQAMFDEVDEGTAVFKCTNDVPVSTGGYTWQTYEGLPSDHYLKLIGLAGRYIREAKPLPQELPNLKSMPPAPELSVLP